MSYMKELIKTMATLRGENGCPWDKEQTLKSLRPYLIEEAYEVLETIDLGQSEKHKEELGDLLLQIIFQAQIRDEQNEFSMEDVIKDCDRKIKNRHPHVFKNDNTIKTSEDVLNKWNDFKKAEGKKISFFGSPPKELSSLTAAMKISKKAVKVGFEWEKIDDIFDKLYEEIDELKEAKNDQERLLEIGDILFVVVNIARRYNIDPEESLRASNRKFIKRFQNMLKLAQEEDLKFESLNIEQMEQLWQLSKKGD